MRTINRRQALISLAAGWVAGSGPALARPLDLVMQSQSLRVAVYRQFPPFSDKEGSDLTGLDVDLAAAIANKLGVTVDYMILTAGEQVDDDLRNAVWKGHYLGGGTADLMLHVPVDPQLGVRNDNVAIIAPYYRERVMVATDPAQTSGGDLVSAFDDHKVGVELDSLADLYLTGAYGGRIRANVVHFRSVDDAAQAMKAGQVAGIMAPLSQIEGALGADRDRFHIGAMPMPGLLHGSWVIGMAVKVNSRDLGHQVEAIVEDFISDGTMARLFTRHGLTYTPPIRKEP